MVFANTPYYANGLKVFPDLSPYDGRMCCGIFRADSLLRTLRLAGRISSQRHLQRPDVEILSGASFQVTSEKNVDLQYDGEVLAGTRGFSVGILPAAINVVAAANNSER
jgi:diacylglycerol kinase family enzyme